MPLFPVNPTNSVPEEYHDIHRILASICTEDSDRGYFQYPRLKDEHQQMHNCDYLIANSTGVYVINVCETSDLERLNHEIERLKLYTIRLHWLFYNESSLVEDISILKFPITRVLINQSIDFDIQEVKDLKKTLLMKSAEEFVRFASNHKDIIDHQTLLTITACVDTSIEIKRPHRYASNELNEGYSKGDVIKLAKDELSGFDRRQTEFVVENVNGLLRVRGLAGSGKTVLLASKAAQMHYENPDALIAYTYFTKSLHQHVRELIRRFYRQRSGGREPNFEKLLIMHGWGGKNETGLYSSICDAHNQKALNLTEARAMTPHDDQNYLDAACSVLLKSCEIRAIYDYIFVDEGQDFGLNFIEMSCRATKSSKVVWAYDNLQNIFDVRVPTPEELSIRGIDLVGDIVLDKCYRNPKETLMLAHATGFGMYGKMVQIIDSREGWELLGYDVIGDFAEGNDIEITRDDNKNMKAISKHYNKESLIGMAIHESIAQEIDFVVGGIREDISQGVEESEILVIIADLARLNDYRSALIKTLVSENIEFNNTLSDSSGKSDFKQEGKITLSSVRKAKGNEAYCVYLVGIDFMFATSPTVIERNMVFTALTRSKGWVKISGVGTGAQRFLDEFNSIFTDLPKMKFIYPSDTAIEAMRKNIIERKDSNSDLIQKDLLNVLRKYGLSADQAQDYLNQTVKK